MSESKRRSFAEFKLPPNTQSLRVDNNDLFSVYPKNSQVLYCPDRTDVADGDLAVVETTEGMIVRRCFLYGDLIALTSFDVFDKPRLINRADCRLWPVLGVYWGENGRHEA